MGVTAIDPPYAAANIAFSIPLPPAGDPRASYALALSPVKSVLLAADGVAATVRILHAPISATSAHENLVIP